MFGRQRAAAAVGVLREAADFMSARQRAGLPLNEILPPFRGLEVGPTFVAKGHSIEQVLDAAVRNITAFGTAEEMLVGDVAMHETARHTISTNAFLGRLRRVLAQENEMVRERFDRILKLPGDLPEVVVDYAFNRWVVQVASLPTTARQTVNAQREAQSKLYELELVRRAMGGNDVAPVLLVNEDALVEPLSSESEDHAKAMQERLVQLAKSFDTKLLGAKTAEGAADLLREMV